MTRRPWLSGILIGAVVGLLVAAAMTSLDWRLNPGGIFHGPAGTAWSVVAETAVSWFLPVAALVAAVAVPVLLWRGRRR